MSLRAISEESIASLTGNLPAQCQSDVDTLRRFVHATVSAGPPTPAIPANEIREVLLTGATGFIGRFFLRELLRQRAELRVHCIVRANSVAHGRERIRAALELAEAWDDSFGSRIEVEIGDISQAQCGLPTARFEDLCRRVDAVYHLAADINLLSSYVDIRKVNTFGVRNVLEICLRRRFKHLFYASTMGVFPQYFCLFANEFKDDRIDHQMQPDLAAMKKAYPLGLLGYPWSKLVSEQALRFAQQTGMPLAILRLPQTNLSSEGYSPANDLGVRMFAAAAQCETLPEGLSFRVSNEAVDTLSRVCAAISLNENRRFTIYHCCNPELDEYDLEPGDFGFYWPQVRYDSFKRACQARGEASPLHGYWAVLDHFGKYWFSRNKPQNRLPICDRAIQEDCPLPIEWTSTLTKLRRSRQWVVRHRREWPYVVPLSHLDFDGLMTRARHYANESGVAFDSAYPGWLRQALQQLVGALKMPEAKLLDEKLGNIVFELSRFLHQNAQIAREAQRHPEIERGRISRPVFIVGINRSGTTLLHRLMARDRRFWALRLYELIQPVLPTGEYRTVLGTRDDPRLARTEKAHRSFEIFEAMEGVHPIGLDEPEEEFLIFKTAFSSWTFASEFHVPAYRRWLAAHGLADAYAFHHRVVQHYTWQRLQARPEHIGQWVFKMPFHLMELENLIETYPDALFIQTHRTPAEVVGSWSSLVERARSVAMKPLPGDKTGVEQLAFLSGMLNGATRFRSAHPELEHRWIDIAYVDLIRDPMKVVRDIYSRFGWPLEQTAVNEMQDWLSWQADLRRGEKRHSYRLKDFGLTAGQVNAEFAPYLDFAAARGIQTEPPVR